LPEPGQEIEARVKVRYKSPELECRFLPPKSGPQSKILSGKGEKAEKAGAGRATPEKTISAYVSGLPDRGEVTLLATYKGVTPGQLAVFYEGGGPGCLLLKRGHLQVSPDLARIFSGKIVA